MVRLHIAAQKRIHKKEYYFFSTIWKLCKVAHGVTESDHYFCIVNFSSNQWNARLHQSKYHTHNDIYIFPPLILVSVMKIIRQTGQNSTLLSQVLKVFVYYAYTSDSWKYRVVYIFNNSILYILLQALIVLFHAFKFYYFDEKIRKFW